MGENEQPAEDGAALHSETESTEENQEPPVESAAVLSETESIKENQQLPESISGGKY